MGNTSVVFVFAIHRDTLLLHVQKSIVDILFHSDSLNKITREHRQKQLIIKVYPFCDNKALTLCIGNG